MGTSGTQGTKNWHFENTVFFVAFDKHIFEKALILF